MCCMRTAAFQRVSGLNPIKGGSVKEDLSPARAGVVPPPLVETLEDRTLFAWPTAPFAAAVGGVERIHTNQFGQARVSAAFTAASRFNGFVLPLVANGTVKFLTSGATPADVAFYAEPGAPTKVDAGSAAAPAQLTVPVETKSRQVYFGVQPATAGSGAVNIVLQSTKPTVTRSNDGAISGEIEDEGE